MCVVLGALEEVVCQPTVEKCDGNELPSTVEHDVFKEPHLN